jgi:hypothetical protein
MEQVKDAISESECRELSAILNKKYSARAKARFFLMEFNCDAFAAYVKVTLRNSSGSFFYPVEGRIDFGRYDMSRRDAGLVIADFIDCYFEEFFKENGECYLPIDWTDYQYEEVNLQVRGQILNLAIEQFADDILAGKDVDIKRLEEIGRRLKHS